MPSPKASFDGLTYTVSLFRPREEETHTFTNEHLTICSCHVSKFTSWERTHISSMGPDSDGILYYIRAQPNDGSPVSFIGLSKEEADALRKAIKDAEDQQLRNEMDYKEGQPCSFCGEILRYCGGDHGDEMRDWQRSVLYRD